MRVILMHGKNTNPTKKWYPWFQKSIKDLNIDFFAPILPKPENPYIKEWTHELEKLNPDKNTILVGHSRGGVAILRWLESPKAKKVKKVILIGTNSGFLKNKAIPEENNNGFYSANGYNFSSIRKKCSEFVVLHSQDDKWVPFSHGKENASGLHAKFLTFKDRGHFGKGVNEIPELLDEIKESATQ